MSEEASFKLENKIMAKKTILRTSIFLFLFYAVIYFHLINLFMLLCIIYLFIK